MGRRKKRWIILLTIIVLVLTTSLYIRYNNHIIMSYLEKNQQAFSLKGFDSSPDFTLLNDDAQKMEIFLLGETHGLIVSDFLDISLLKSLKSKTNIKYYLGEASYSYGKFINQYIQTGDEEILDEVSIYNPYVRKDREKLKALYKYNQSLPPDERIEYIGIDLENPKNLAIWYINTILPDKKPPEDITKEVAILRRAYMLKQYGYNQIKEIADYMTNSLQTKTEAIKEFFGDNYFDFAYVIQNWQNAYISDNDRKYFDKRDSLMYNNFTKIYNHYQQGKFYGKLGSFHIYQDDIITFDVFATHLAKDDRFKGKILSLKILYQDGNKSLLLKPYNSKDFFGLIPEMANLSDENALMFKLNNTDSPLKRLYLMDSFEKYLTFYKFFTSKTTDYFQYLFILKKNENLPWKFEE